MTAANVGVDRAQTGFGDDRPSLIDGSLGRWGERVLGARLAAAGAEWAPSLAGVVIVTALVATTAGACSESTDSSSSIHPAVDVPAAPSVVAQAADVPMAVADAIGLPPGLPHPSPAPQQPPLLDQGKPAILFIGAEYCPCCAAERWALVVALSRFGSFTGLEQTRSSPWDVYQSTATFSFKDARYSSPYVVFVPREYEGNDTDGPDTRKPLMHLTQYDVALWKQYSSSFGIPVGIPFVDVGNRVLMIHAPYDPATLTGLTQKQIAAQLHQPRSPVARAVVGSANYLTIGICSITGMQPSSVCTRPWETAAGANG